MEVQYMRDKKPTDEMYDAYYKAMKRFIRKHGEPTLGLLAGGCPNCGHLCSFDEENFKCHRCGWYWKDEAE